MRTVRPLNPMPDGTCRTIKAQYQQSSIANFIRADSFASTGVIEYETNRKPQIVPINTDVDGNARCLKAGYYKMGLTNFLRGVWADKEDGFRATAILEYYEDKEA